jgi:hypothetical protein
MHVTRDECAAGKRARTAGRGQGEGGVSFPGPTVRQNARAGVARLLTFLTRQGQNLDDATFAASCEVALEGSERERRHGPLEVADGQNNRRPPETPHVQRAIVAAGGY